MPRVLILGATGSLGSEVTRQAVSAGHQVTAVVRTPSKLPAELRGRLTIKHADLAMTPDSVLAGMFRQQDVVINAAGMVTDGEIFVDLFDRVVSALELLPARVRPVSWFLAGAAVLDFDARGRRGVDLPWLARTYWPHRANYDRLRRTALDWRLLCPGPMVDRPAIGLSRLRVSLDRLPVQVPAVAGLLPSALVLPVFVARVPEMIVPYADAAALMLANLTPGGWMSGHRIGLALPVGVRGSKEQWTASPKATVRGGEVVGRGLISPVNCSLGAVCAALCDRD
jgi:putative NADH-flavin reductase